MEPGSLLPHPQDPCAGNSVWIALLRSEPPYLLKMCLDQSDNLDWLYMMMERLATVEWSSPSPEPALVSLWNSLLQSDCRFTDYQFKLLMTSLHFSISFVKWGYLCFWITPRIEREMHLKAVMGRLTMPKFQQLRLWVVSSLANSQQNKCAWSFTTIFFDRLYGARCISHMLYRRVREKRDFKAWRLWCCTCHTLWLAVDLSHYLQTFFEKSGPITKSKWRGTRVEFW